MNEKIKKTHLLLPGITLILFIFQFSSCSLQTDQEKGSNTIAPFAPVQKSVIQSSGRWTGVSWYGFETGNLCPHCLWGRDYKSMLKQIRDLGFNSIRLPWCIPALTGTPQGIQINAYAKDAYTGETNMNIDLNGLSSIQVMDKIIDVGTRVYGLKFILDCHSLAPGNYESEPVWYSTAYPESAWIAAWTNLAGRYKNNPYVVACDLKNEPHGNTGTGYKPPATWGYQAPGFDAATSPTDWKAAAERCGKAILAVNPNMIICVEGVEEYSNANVGDNYFWWGGNLMGVSNAQIDPASIPAGHIVYSWHEYGPDLYPQPYFSDPNFPNNMPGIWNKTYYFIAQQNIAPLWMGEFGVTSSSLQTNSTTSTWYKNLLAYVGNSVNWSYWCFNNNGEMSLLKSDLVSINTDSYNPLKPYLAAQFPPLGGSSSSSSAASSIAVSSVASSAALSSAASSAAVSSSRSSAASSVAVSSSRSSVASSIASSVAVSSSRSSVASSTAVSSSRASVASSAAVSSAASSVSTSSSLSASSGYAVNYTVSNDWGAGATVTVTMKNNSAAAVNGWTLVWTFAGNQTITQIWSATQTSSGATVTAKSLSYNGTIGANGGTQNFGFNLSYSGANAKPAAFTLNGTACTIY